MKIKCTLCIAEELTSVAFNFGLKKTSDNVLFFQPCHWVHWPPSFQVGEYAGKKQDHVLDT